MVFWSLAIALTAIACAALYYASAGRPVNAAAGTGADPVSAHHRLQLRELEADIAAGRLGEAEALAAKAELAREVLRLEGEKGPAEARGPGPAVVGLSIAAVAVLALGIYWQIGSPDLPAAPLSARAEIPPDITIEEAIARIEAQLSRTPNDLQAWTVVAPAYMGLGRFADAERAFRMILTLAPPTAEAETSLAEALLLQNGGVMAGEPLALLRSAAARDPAHVRSRLYLADGATRAGDFAVAKAGWTELIGLANGDEPWLELARDGLETAERGLMPPKPEADAQLASIRAMVDGLSERLLNEGGSIEEWTELVRSRLVLDEKDAAQRAYDLAVAAYPDAAQRAELDALALGNGLKMGSSG